ncbi:MAG: hypothetical protein FJ098_07095, partial [Deltaproteobacteria bacterium]|nr:hypothetical protein [Deltaproteobacteria bacterium]
MKRTTLIVLGVFLVLLALWIGLRSGGEPPADHRLEVAPVRSGDGARDDEPEGAKGPPDRLEVVRRGVRVVLAREGDDWQVLEPAPGGAQAF